MPLCLTHAAPQGPGRTLFTLSFIVNDTIATLQVLASLTDGVRIVDPSDAWGRPQQLSSVKALPAPKGAKADPKRLRQTNKLLTTKGSR